MSVPPCLMAAGAETIDTKGSLGINSALALSFWVLSHAKTPGGWRAEGGTLTITASHWVTVGDRHFRLIDKWKEPKWLPFKRKGTYQNRRIISSIFSQMGNVKRWVCMANWAHNSVLWQRPFRPHAHNAQRYRGRLKLKINEASSRSASNLRGFASKCSFPSIGKLFWLC